MNRTFLALGAGGALAAFLYYLRQEQQIAAGQSRYWPLVQRIASEVSIPADILGGVVWKESSWNNAPGLCSATCGVTCAASCDGYCTIGLAQTLPSTAAREGVTGDLCIEENSLRAGALYLKRMYDKYGDWRTALAAYNWGPGNVNRALAAGKTSFPGQSYADKVLGRASSYRGSGLAGVSLFSLR